MTLLDVFGNDKSQNDPMYQFFLGIMRSDRGEEIRDKMVNRRIKRTIQRKINKGIIKTKDLKKLKKEITKNIILNREEAKIYYFFEQNIEKAFTANSFAMQYGECDNIVENYDLERKLLKMVREGKLKGFHYKGKYYYYLK